MQNDVIVEDFDLVVLGSGEGGKYLAWTLAKEGLKVAVVERKYIGGSCPNIACLPSKNIIHSAKVASLIRRGEEFGMIIDGFRVDALAVRDRKRTMVDDLVAIHVKNYAASGAALMMGTGRFIGPKTIEVLGNDGTTQVIRGKDIVIGTGTRAKVEDIPGLAAAQPWTHIEALELDVIPDHLLVLGGGYVGLELAQAASRLGSKVTILDRNDRLLNRGDEDVSESLQSLFEDEGIELILGAEVHGVSGRSGEGVEINFTQSGRERLVAGTHLLVATGRTPNTEGLNVEVAGVELTETGYVKVNERLQTTAPGVWAIGEVAGTPQFTHISLDDFRVIRANLAGRDRVTTGRQVPYTVFTDPELAHIGMSEKEAKSCGVKYRLFKIPMASVLRTRTLSETRGFLKALVDDHDRIIGFTAFGVSAGEMMGVIQIAMLGNLPYTSIRDAVLTHPTMIEGFVPLFISTPVREGA